jgi:hypothetical protein
MITKFKIFEVLKGKRYNAGYDYARINKFIEKPKENFWSINFTDPYVVFKIKKLLKDSLQSKIRIHALISATAFGEVRPLYINPSDASLEWNTFTKEKFIDNGWIYKGDVELTPEEKDMADMELDAKKYNL